MTSHWNKDSVANALSMLGKLFFFGGEKHYEDKI